MKKNKNFFHKYFLVFLIVLLVIFLFLILNYEKRGDLEVNDFESCVKAGYPVMESYPRKCASGNEVYVEDIKEECVVDSDCDTPFYYLTQSNCPYTSLCIDNSCNVVCPISLENKTDDFWKVSCKTDLDCNCTRVFEDLKSCSCIDNQCYAVMKGLN